MRDQTYDRRLLPLLLSLGIPACNAGESFALDESPASEATGDSQYQLHEGLEAQDPDADDRPSAPGSLGNADEPMAITPGFDLQISLDGADVVLAWGEQGEGMNYEVWRSHAPYFEPEDGHAEIIATLETPTFADAGANDANDYYYRIRAIGLDEDSTLSTTVGKNAYPLQKGYTNLGLCLLDDIDTASELFASVGESAISAHKWDEAAQSWTWSWASAGGDGIGFSPGEAVAINVGDGYPEHYTSVGYVPTMEDIEAQLEPGLNIVTMLPYSLGAMMASELLSVLPSATAIHWWDPATQSTMIYAGPGDEDFELARCGHVKVEVTETTAWPPIWCPQESTNATVSAGDSVSVLGTTVSIDAWDEGEGEVRVAVHGTDLNPATPSYPDDTCSGGVVEVMPAAGGTSNSEPLGTLTWPCDAGTVLVEHARLDGSYDYARGVCDVDAGEASISFSGFGHFTLEGTVVPGCEECSGGSGLSVCDVSSWWPQQGECYSPPEDMVVTAIGPDGGVISHPEGATLTIPAGALGEDVSVSLGTAWGVLPNRRLEPGQMRPWQIDVQSTNTEPEEFLLPATLELDCATNGERILVHHNSDVVQSDVTTCEGGVAALGVRSFGTVVPDGTLGVTTVDAGGGHLTMPDGVEITVPAGALSETAALSVVEISDDLGPERQGVAVGGTYMFLPHGQTFSSPVEFRIPAPDCVPGRTLVRSRYDMDDPSWEEIPAQCVDGFAVFEDDSFSVKEAADSVALTNSICGCRCGDDIRNMLDAVGAAMVAQWNASPNRQEQASACGRRIGLSNWEMRPLFGSEVRRFGDGAERGTVTVDGQCYFAGEVNYFMWGVSEALCESIGHGTNEDFWVDLQRNLANATSFNWRERARRESAGRKAWTRAGKSAVSVDLVPFTPADSTFPATFNATAWHRPTEGTTGGADLTGGQCSPSPSSQRYTQATEEGASPTTSWVWYWGGSWVDSTSPVYNGIEPVPPGPPSPPDICANDDTASAVLGEEGVLVAMAPNDQGVYPNLAMSVQGGGAFDAVATHDVGGIPHVELSSDIPTEFSELETVTYRYQPEGGGIESNLEALIDITPSCPVPEGDRPSEFHCGCSGGREWTDGECVCPNGAWDPDTESCETDPCEGGTVGYDINPATGQCEPLDTIIVSGTGEHCGASDVHYYIRAFNGSGSYSLQWSGSPPGPPNANGSPAWGNWRGFSIVDDVTGATLWSNCCVYNDVAIVAIQPGAPEADCSGVNTCRCGGHRHCGYVN